MKNKTPDSSHFAVVFLVLIALLFGLYALYHNRGKVCAGGIHGRLTSAQKVQHKMAEWTIPLLDKLLNSENN